MEATLKWPGKDLLGKELPFPQFPQIFLLGFFLFVLEFLFALRAGLIGHTEDKLTSSFWNTNGIAVK